MGATINIYMASGATAPAQAPGAALDVAAQDTGASAALQPDAGGQGAMAPKQQQMVDAGEAPAALVAEVEAALRKAAETGPRTLSSSDVAAPTDAGSAPS